MSDLNKLRYLYLKMLKDNGYHYIFQIADEYAGEDFLICERTLEGTPLQEESGEYWFNIYEWSSSDIREIIGQYMLEDLYDLLSQGILVDRDICIDEEMNKLTKGDLKNDIYK